MTTKDKGIQKALGQKIGILLESHYPEATCRTVPARPSAVASAICAPRKGAEVRIVQLRGLHNCALPAR